jgi:hypothetical protein
VVDEPRLVEAGDQAGEERGVQWRGHVLSMLALSRHNLK